MFDIQSLIPRVTEEMISRTMENYPFSAWPQDEAELAALFNFMLEDLLVSSAPVPFQFAPG
ncbi:hypothetical protein [Novosphingobium sp. P6W]|jgi:hypothetical protein|uniref:hypothetical protein n=1 Tax=Novosphingobium sp. P6W TaxID=1609758 RepID=UPI000A67DEAE|nr:hypothetical protein [Novosphingobium sp. P6W]AXB75539.1 hypothetical protein TQ38_002615 [Novosphingobium sp. P6W]